MLVGASVARWATSCVTKARICSCECPANRAAWIASDSWLGTAHALSPIFTGGGKSPVEKCLYRVLRETPCLWVSWEMRIMNAPVVFFIKNFQEGHHSPVMNKGASSTRDCITTVFSLTLLRIYQKRCNISREASQFFMALRP